MATGYFEMPERLPVRRFSLVVSGRYWHGQLEVPCCLSRCWTRL